MAKKFTAKEKFDMMGKIVTVSALAVPVYEDESGKATTLRTIKSEPLRGPQAGWIVGFSVMQEGIYHPSSGGGRYGEYGEYEQAYLTPVSHVPVVLVCFWPGGKANKVKTEDFVMGGEPKRSQATMSDSDKEALRQEMKSWPRDEKGHWIKKQKTLELK
jgi:hypothetical protein